MITIILLFLTIYLLIDASKEYHERKYLESILNYYKWHNILFDIPPHSGWYLVQTNDNKQRIKVLYYSMKKECWEYPDKNMLVAYCRLPNYLYPQ